jgi:hypothetical protein
MMNTTSDKISSVMLIPGKKPNKTDRWECKLLRQAIYENLPASGEVILFNRFSGLLKDKLDRVQLVRLKSLPWYTTAVKLELEVKGEIYRYPVSTPQRLLQIN